MTTTKAYLRNGEEVILHKELIASSEFVIERMYTYSDYDGNEDSEPSGTKEIVTELFSKPPIEKKHDELIKIIQKTEVKNKELADIETQIRAAKAELRKSEEFKTNLQKHIINKSELVNARRLTVFCKYKAYDLKEGEGRKNMQITYKIKLVDNKFSAWATEIWSDGFTSNNSINSKYGILVDATDEEVLAIGKQIVSDAGEISEWDLMSQIPDEYLSEKLLSRKKQILKDRAKKSIAELEASIKDKKEKIKKLRMA